MISHNQPFLDEKDKRAVLKVLSTRWIAEGKSTRQFEHSVARLLKRKYAKSTSSGTAALHLALLALGIKKGDEIIVSTYACTALLNAVFYAGARPLLSDIDEKSFGLSPRHVRRLITRRTRAIIVNHAFGFPADIQKISSFGVPVIEDCAQSLGSSVGNRPLGSFGDLTICSFYATKVIAAGYGGMVLTDRPQWAEKIRDLTLYDRRRDYKVRYNYSISDINSALGLSQLEKLKSFVAKRRKIAKLYARALSGSDLYYWMGRPQEQPNFYRFMALGLKPYSFYTKKLQKRGVGAVSVLEPYQLLHRYLSLDPKKFPAAEAISRSAFSVPLYPALTEEQTSRIVSALRGL